MTRRIWSIVGICLGVLTLMGDACYQEPPSPVGFTLHTQRSSLNSCFFFCTEDEPGIQVSGYWVHDPYPNPPLSLTNGWVYSMNATTGNNALYEVVGGRAAATWSFTELNGICAGKSAYGQVPLAGTQPLICYYYTVFSFSPDSLPANGSAVVAQVSGAGITATYGMPHLIIYDYWGNFVTEVVASSVSQDGSYLLATVPSMPNSGLFAVVVSNVGADGNLQIIGGTTFGVYGLDPPPPPPPSDDCSSDPTLPSCVENNS
jgi:hypothetical protein